MSDGENFSRGPFFIYKNPESVSYTISTGGGGSGCGNMKNLNAEVTYDALRNRIAELEAALQDMAKHVWRGDWDKLKPETKKLLGEQK